MVILNIGRTRKLLFLLIVSALTGVFIILGSKHSNNEERLDPLPFLGVSVPDLSEYEFLPSSATPCSSKAPQLLAFIHSSPTNIPHRDAIRKTWGSSSYQDIKTVFIVGRSRNDKVWKRIQQEAEEFGDLVLPSFLDSYKNLTLKHMLGLKWIISNCPTARFILKADDDIFVDTLRLSSLVHLFLGDNAGSKNSLVCHVIPDGTSPKRSGKWMVTEQEYPYDEYPEYCSGLAYFARLSALKKIYDIASSGGVPYLRIDDIFITGLAATLAGVKRQNLGVRFANTELPVIEWMKKKTLRPCAWMVAEISPYYWPNVAFSLWNKTVHSWEKLNRK